MRFVSNHKHMIFSNEQNLKSKIIVESFFSLIIYINKCIMFKNSILPISSALFNNMLFTIIKYYTLDTHSEQQ